MRRALVPLGVLVAAFGVLFLLQGAGIVRWPAESFMLGRRVWVIWGAIIAAIGAALIVAGRGDKGSGSR